MSEASSTAPQSSAPVTRGRHQRSVRNYLLDQRFQLKYTGFLVGIAVVLSVALGIGLWTTSSEIIRQSQHAVEQGKLTVAQGQETVRRHQEAIEQSQIASNIVKMNIAKEYKDYPELAKIFEGDAQGNESRLNEEQERLKRDAANLEMRARSLERQAAEVAGQQRTFLGVLVVILSLLVLGVGAAGIVFTHKIAGPIFKMKRLLRQVGEGKLVVREKLRRGDELQHFFEAFEKMVEDLRAHQQSKIAQVDVIVEKLETASSSQDGLKQMNQDGVALLKKLRGDMQEQLEA